MWNRLKTVVLLAVLSGLLMLLGGFIGGTSGVTVAFIMAMVMNGLVYFFSDRLVLSLYGAKQLDKTKYEKVYSVVSELSSKMEIPMPKLWLVNMPVANAFATGRNPAKASVAITNGIVELLEPYELRAVLAHELSHVKNRDILIATVAATLATAISYLAHMVQNIFFWSSVNDKRRSGNPIILLVVAIIMPIAAMFIQLAISRSREYLADETGAYVSEDPLALASALEKLQNNVRLVPLNSKSTVQASTASLFIVYPFIGEGLINLFSTHPPIKRRVMRLRNIYEKMTSC
jgi:heat shock protein HtpX